MLMDGSLNTDGALVIQDEPRSAETLPAKVSELRRQLATAKTVEEVQQVIAMTKGAETFIQTLAGQAKTNREAEQRLRAAQRELHAIAIDAKVQLGKLLQSMEKSTGYAGHTHPGMRGITGGSQSEPPVNVPTLADVGISKKAAFEAQRLASLPPEKLDAVKAGEIPVYKAIASGPPADPVPPKPTKEQQLEARIVALEKELEDAKTYLEAAESTAEALTEELKNLQAVAAGEEANRLRQLTEQLRAAEGARNSALTAHGQADREAKKLAKQVAALEARIRKFEAAEKWPS